MIGNASAYAKYRGCTPSAVSRAIQGGRLRKSLTKKGKDYVIDFSHADEEWSSQTNSKATDDGPTIIGDNDHITLNEARRRNEIKKLELAEIQLAKQRGDMILAAEAEQKVFAIMRVVRDRLLAMPPRIAGAVMEAKDEPTAILSVKKELQMVLDEASVENDRRLAGA